MIEGSDGAIVMDRISPHRLWIGHAGDGRDVLRLREVGIKAIFLLAIEEMPPPLPRDLISLRFPLIDGAGNRPEILELAIRSVSHWVAHRIPTLVCCGAGMSRSPAIVAAALSLSGHGPAEDCLEAVTRHRRCDVSPGLWSEIRNIFPR